MREAIWSWGRRVFYAAAIVALIWAIPGTPPVLKVEGPVAPASEAAVQDARPSLTEEDEQRDLTKDPAYLRQMMAEELEFPGHDEEQERLRIAEAARLREIHRQPDGTLVARSPLGFTGYFSARGVTVLPPGASPSEADRAPWVLSYELQAIGRESRMMAPYQTPPSHEGQRVRYERAQGTEELWENHEFGLEQTVTIQERPAGQGDILVDGVIGGTLTAVETDGRISLRNRNKDEVLVYEKLIVRDADGLQLPARMELAGNVVRLRVNDAGARYPVEIDPTLTASYLSTFATSLDGWSYTGSPGYSLWRNTGEGQPAACMSVSGNYFGG